ncbi:daf-12-interacting protein 1-like isoform X2 [Portunus trituberculatus]|nr:daf-12-interacting protein 1-like isoform X2 [Portunus trituberculatus]
MDLDGWDSDQETIIFNPKQDNHPPRDKCCIPSTLNTYCTPPLPPILTTYQTPYPPPPTPSQHYHFHYPPPNIPILSYYQSQANPYPNPMPAPMTQPPLVPPPSQSVPKSRGSVSHPHGTPPPCHSDPKSPGPNSQSHFVPSSQSVRKSQDSMSQPHCMPPNQSVSKSPGPNCQPHFVPPSQSVPKSPHSKPHFVPPSQSVPKSQYRAHGYHRSTHSHIRSHKKPIHFPKTNTRYSRMKLNVGCLDHSGKGFLHALYLNRNQIKTCWEREIILHVPPKLTPDPVPTSECRVQPDSLRQYEELNLEMMLNELQKDMEIFMTDDEDEETGVDSASVTRPPMSPPPVIFSPSLPLDISKPSPAIVTRPSQYHSQATSTIKPPPASVTRPSHPRHFTNPSQTSICIPTQQASVTRPSQYHSQATSTIKPPPASVTRPSHSRHFTNPSQTSICIPTQQASVTRPSQYHSQATSTIKPPPASVTRPSHSRHFTNPSQASICIPTQQASVTRPSQYHSRATSTIKPPPASVTRPSQPRHLTNPSQASTSKPTEPASHTLTEPRRSEPVANTSQQERQEQPSTTEVSVSSLLALLKSHTTATSPDPPDATAASGVNSPGQGNTNTTQNETIVLKLMRLLQEGGISEVKDGRHVVVFEAPKPDPPSTSEQGMTQAPPHTPQTPHTPAMELDREERKRSDKERRKVSKGERRETQWEENKDKNRRHKMNEAAVMKEREREMEDRNQRKHKNNEREETKRVKNNKDDKNRKRRREEGEEKTETELNQNEKRKQENEAKKSDKRRDTKEKETKYNKDKKKTHRQRSRSPSSKRRRSTRSPSSSSISSTSTADSHTHKRKTSKSSRTTSTAKDTRNSTQTHISSHNNLCNIPRDIQAAEKVKGGTTQHQTPLEAQREALLSVGEVKTAEKAKRNRWDQEDRREKIDSVVPQVTEKAKRNRWDQKERDSASTEPSSEKQSSNPVAAQEDTGVSSPSKTRPQRHTGDALTSVQEDLSSISVSKSSKVTGKATPHKATPPASPQSRTLAQEDRRRIPTAKCSKKLENSTSTPQKPGQMQIRRPSEEDTSNTSVHKHSKKLDNSSLTPQKPGQTQVGRLSQEDTNRTSSLTPQKPGQTQVGRLSQEDTNRTSSLTPQKPGQTQVGRLSQEDTSNTSVPKSSEKPENSTSTPQKSTQRSKGDTQLHPQNHSATPVPESSKNPRTLALPKKPPQTHTNNHTASLSPTPAPCLTSPITCTSSPPAGVVVKEEPLFLLSEMEIKQEPLSPNNAMRQRELEDLARQVKRKDVRVKQEPVSNDMRMTTTTDTHRNSTAVKTEPDETVTHLSSYEVVEKSEPFLEEEHNYKEVKSFPSLEKEQEVERSKVRYLTRETLGVLGMEDGTDSDKWDSQVPETLYGHLKNILKLMKCSVWEESNWLSYNWEVNLRRLVVAMFCREELDTFTSNIHTHMKKTEDLKVFIRSVVTSNAIP